MPQGDRTGIADALMNRREGQGFFRTAGRGIARAWNATPIAHFARGDFLGGFNATPMGMIIAQLRGGNPLGPNNSRAFLNARDMGPPSDLAGSEDTYSMGPPASLAGNTPTMPGVTVTAPRYTGAANAADIYGGAAGGLGHLMGPTPIKQSGMTFRTFQHEV